MNFACFCFICILFFCILDTNPLLNRLKTVSPHLLPVNFVCNRVLWLTKVYVDVAEFIFLCFVLLVTYTFKVFQSPMILQFLANILTNFCNLKHLVLSEIIYMNNFMTIFSYKSHFPSKIYRMTHHFSFDFLHYFLIEQFSISF